MSEQSTQLVDVLAAHRFDEAALADYLAGVMPEQFTGPLHIRQFQGGQSNPTFLLESGGSKYVLRKKPPGKLLPSAHMVEREYKVIAALKDTPVAVPEALHLCEDASVIGTAFYVMRFVEGRVFPHPRLEDLAPDQRRNAFRAAAQTLAHLHQVDYEAVGLSDFGKPANYIARQIDRWSKQYEASRTDHKPAMEELMSWLPNNIPENAETTIAHGDFRMGNLMFHSQKEEVVAVLDWELSTLGHPLSDLAYCCIPYTLPIDTPGLGGLKGLDLKALGIPEEQEFVDMYCAARGRDGGIDRWPFYSAFALFRLAAILQGVYKRALDGNAANADALEVGQRAGLLAEAAMEQAQKL
ncbi:phosphotransferase [Gilvimarinus sp. F26214L]|uniref:phosphotransferase n=1 Tax=Gilvimarinus sp. DZF01 TaxID=3461371 RepID=UPI0040461604